MANFNDIKDTSLIAAKGEELLRKRQDRALMRSVEEVRATEDLIPKLMELQELDKKTGKYLQMTVKDREEARVALLAIIQKQNDELRRLEQIRMHGIDKNFKSSLRNLLSEGRLSADIRGVAQSSSVLNSSLDIARTMSTADIHVEMTRSREAAVRASAKIKSISENLDVPGNEMLFMHMLKARDRLTETSGMYAAGLSTQKDLGIDSRSRFYRINELTQGAMREQQALQIKQEVRAGVHTNRGQIEEQLNNTLQKLITTFERLDSVTDKNSDEALQLANEFDKVEKEASKFRTILGEMDRAGAGGGGRGNLFAAMGIAGGLGTMVGAGAAIYRHVGITSELSNMQNKTGFAALQNERFLDQLRASRGDMAAFRRVLTDQAKTEAEFGLMMGERQGVASGFSAVGQGGVAIGSARGSVDDLSQLVTMTRGTTGGIAGKTPVSAMALMAGQLAVQSGANAAPGIANAAMGITDWARMNPQMATALQAASTQKQFLDTLNAIGDTSGQAYHDAVMSIGLGTRGAGRGRSGLADSLMANLGNFSEMGLNGGDVGGLGRFGLGALGREFNANDGLRAAALSQRGFLQSPEHYLQARGVLAGVGGGAQDLEEIMANAVAHGMDSSKNILEVVQGIGTLANRNAAMGINTATGTSQTAMRSLDAMMGLGLTPNMAAAAAMNSADAANAISGSSNLDIFNVMEFAELSAAFPDAKPWELSRLAKLTPDKLNELESASKNGTLTQATVQMGIPSRLLDGGKALPKLRGITGRQTIGAATGMLGLDREKEIQIAKLRAQGVPQSQWPVELREFFGGHAIGIDASVSNHAIAKGDTSMFDSLTGVAKNAEASKSAAAISDSRMVIGAKDRLDKTIGSDNLGIMMQNISRNVDVNASSQATKNAAEAGTFTKGQFDNHIIPFTNAVDDVKDKFRELSRAIDSLTLKINNNGSAANPANNSNPRQRRP